MTVTVAPVGPVTRPPGWLIAATVTLAVICLALAVAETTLWMHYLIDSGEYISLAGLAFILVAGISLYRRHRLFVSLPLTLPWLLYPVITQGDQIIDNLSINAMRAIVQFLLALIFATPVAVLVLAARVALAPASRAASPPAWTACFPGLRLLARGRIREGSAMLASALFVLELWVAVQYLGTLMVITLIVLILATLMFGSIDGGPSAERRERSERAALLMLIAGVAISLALFVGYKNRPGAYQGSPSFLMDPSQAGAVYQVNARPVPSTPVAMPSSPESVRAALNAYGRTLEKLLAGYYILDRNYTWDFHNELFLRQTPLLPGYRAAGLALVREARGLRDEADRMADVARASLSNDDRLAALIDDLRAFAAFNFERGPMLEQMSAGFEQTKAGLQHAAHLYEGEGKFLSSRLHEITEKHRVVLTSSAAAPVTSEFNRISQAIYQAYENRIVGF